MTRRAVQTRVLPRVGQAMSFNQVRAGRRDRQSGLA
jgi:hypothetical protein